LTRIGTDSATEEGMGSDHGSGLIACRDTQVRSLSTRPKDRCHQARQEEAWWIRFTIGSDQRRYSL
jgi:hypothetical protein